MKIFEHRNPNHCDPPGAFREILSHPALNDTKAIEQATFKEHRFAFFYWLKWYKELKVKNKCTVPPTLISIDFHRDLAKPNNREKEELLETKSYNLSALAFFCWARMNPLNDGHILSAQYLNIIGDVILLKHQKSFGVKGGEREKRFVDFYNNKHRIYEFDVVDKFESFVVNYKTNQIFFDIDLDYFVKKVGDYMDGDGYEIMSEQEIAEIVNPSRPLFKKIYQCIEGFTVATEQKHCGGLINSFKILSIIENQLFSSGKKWK